jgi:hypothetical protein
MAKTNALDLITRRLRSYGIDLYDYVADHPTKGKMIKDMGSEGRGVNFVPQVSKLPQLEEKLLNASSPSGGRAFAGRVEKWLNIKDRNALSRLIEDSSNASLMISFSATHGDGFRELRTPVDSSSERVIFPNDGRDNPSVNFDPVFAIKDSAIAGGSLHVALESDYCNIHIDDTICFLTGKADTSLDTGQHWANELKFKTDGMFGDFKQWDKLSFRRTNYSAIATSAFIGLYVGNGVLGGAVRGGNGLNLGAAVAPALLGAAGYLAGRFLPESTLKVMDHFSLVVPNTGSLAPHFGLRFKADLGDFGPLENLGLTANMFYDINHLDTSFVTGNLDKIFSGGAGSLLSGDVDGISIGKSASVSVHGTFW